MSQAHPTDEQLSAALDGEDPGASRHAESCEACQARLAALRAVVEAVSLAPPVDELARERAIAAALDTPMAPVGPIGLDNAGQPRGWGRSPGVGVALGAAAALIAVLLLVPRLAGGRDNADTAASARRDDKASGMTAADAVAGPATVDGGDLGEVSDPRALSALVSPAIGSTGGGAGAGASSNALSGESSEAASTTTSPGPAATTVPGVGAAPQTASGTSARIHTGAVTCASAVAKDYSQGLGPLLYTATVRWQGKNAVVLAYRLAAPTGTLDYRVFVLARSGCALLTVVSV